jgi:hypothetical protein
MTEVEHRILPFYRRALICELDPDASAGFDASPTAATSAGRSVNGEV